MSRAVLVLTVVAAASVPAELLLPGPKDLVVLPLGVVVGYALCLRLLWAGRIELASNLFVGGALSMLAAIVVPLGGIDGTVPPFLVASAIVAVLLLEPRWALFAVGAHVAVLAGAPYLAQLPIPRLEVPPSGGVVSHIMAILEVVVLCGLTVDALDAMRAEARRRAAESLASVEEARIAAEGKARFLATMSHELRTPLNAILGYAGLLREETPADDDLQRIESAGQHLLGLVEDLLELARVEAATVRSEPTDLREVAPAALDGLGRTGVPVEGPADVQARTDPVHLLRLVSGLIRGRRRRGPDRGRARRGDRRPPPPGGRRRDQPPGRAAAAPGRADRGRAPRGPRRGPGRLPAAPREGGVTGRELVIQRSIAALIAAVAVWMVAGLVVPLGVRQLEGGLYGGLLLVALGVATRRPVLAARVLIGIGGPALGWRVVATGGPESPLAVYLPVLTMAAWSWLGRGRGVVTVLLACGCLVVGAAHDPPAATPFRVEAYASRCSGPGIPRPTRPTRSGSGPT
jgi:signal transduction histidine kinase